VATPEHTPAHGGAAQAPSAPELALAALFRDASPAETRRLLARLERAGAALYERLAAAEPDPRTREALLAAARREIANAEVLEGLGGEGDA
jgi:hypothetical protein